MSKDGMARAFAEAEASYKARVVHATFGHLDPNPGHAYRGGITIAVGHRDRIIMDYKFRGLPDSPLLAMTMQDIFDRVPKKARPGSVYVWLGYLIRYKNGKSRLTKGQMGRCKLIHPFKVSVGKERMPKPSRKSTSTNKPINGHEYLAQGHGKAQIVNDYAQYKLYEVLDLTENGKVVFLHPTYEGCQNWIDGKPLDAPRKD